MPARHFRLSDIGWSPDEGFEGGGGRLRALMDHGGDAYQPLRGSGGAPMDSVAFTGGATSLLAADAGAQTINGGSDPDILSGGGSGDTINGLAGNDTLYGYGAADASDPNSGAIIATRIATGLSSPVFACSPPGDPDRLFVIEQHTGRIMILDLANNQVSSTPFLDIPDGQLAGSGEEGLLGLAFHPDYATNGKFYVYIVNASGNLEIRQYTRSAGNPDAANTTFSVVMTISHPGETNHNGGWLGFGPDGMLWIATGDGGGGGDPDNSAQDLNSLLGKLLRIDIDGDDFPADNGKNYAIPDDNPFVGVTGSDEIWGYGLRNPWRCSFDPVTGALYIADVGQGAKEEVNFIPAGTPGGINFGWHVVEGDQPYDTNTPGNPSPTDPSLWDPSVVYGHNSATGGFSITGGYAYYGPGGAQGVYFFSDYVSGHIWTASIGDDGTLYDFTMRDAQIQASAGTVNSISSFAVDGQGRLYAIGLDGEIFRLTPSTSASDGADTLNGGDGDDLLYGGAANDVLNGDNDDDRLQGGIGNDTLTGGADADQFWFNVAAFGSDTVTDFENGTDKIRITGIAGIDDFSDLVISTNGSGWAVITLPDGSNVTLTGITAGQVDASDFLFS